MLRGNEIFRYFFRVIAYLRRPLSQKFLEDTAKWSTDLNPGESAMELFIKKKKKEPRKERILDEENQLFYLIIKGQEISCKGITVTKMRILVNFRFFFGTISFISLYLSFIPRINFTLFYEGIRM